jgi:cation diffusion facilitator family transporter
LKEEHPHDHEKNYGHTHGAVDPSIITTSRGIRAVKWSFIALMVTALLQISIVYISGSVALLADTVHNYSDAATAIPLWIAFSLARRKPNKQYTYGYGRVEDLAGILIVVLILFSAFVAGYESIIRLINPREVIFLRYVAIAALIGFVGNEAVAQFRIKTGKEIGSAALIADGYHARVDGFTSLAVLLGAIGVWMGYPLADPAIGLIITIAILKIVWDSGKMMFSRLLDGVDPEVIDELSHAVSHVEGVEDVSDIRVRWIGHRLHAEINIAVDPDLSVSEGHRIADDARKELLNHLKYLSGTTIHVDPSNESGEKYHSNPILE